MTHKLLFTSFTLVVLIAGFIGTAVGQDTTIKSSNEPVAALKAIAADRHGTISGLVAIWEPQVAKLGFATEAWKPEFTSALEGANDQQLLDIQGAKTYSAVQAILQGRDTIVTIDGVVGPEALGDLTQDLVFTPVVPCRIFDTRYDDFGGQGGGFPPSVLHYYVHGSAALLAPQGHNNGVVSGPGCPSPKGEPVAIAANFTVANTGANGNIRAWPYGATMPNASLLNYQAGVNLANAGIIATCYLCAYDMSVATSYGASDSLADVMGYFYPAVQVPPVVSRGLLGTVIPYGGCTNQAGGSVTITTPSSGYVTVTAQVSLNIEHAQGFSGTQVNIYLGSTPTECSGFNLPVAVFREHNQAPSYDGKMVTLPISRVFPVAAGTHTFYVNGLKAASDVATIVQFWGSGMQAHFTAN